MANFVDIISGKFKQYAKKITLVFFVILFLGLGYYFYTRVFKKKYEQDKTFKDVANDNPRKDEIVVYFVTVPWCPYCKKALGDWNQFVGDYEGKEMNNGSRVHCIQVDEKDPNSDQFENIKEKYNIDKFPTVFILYGGKRYDFDSAVTYYALDQFVQTVAV